MTDQNLLLQENGYPNAPDIKARLIDAADQNPDLRKLFYDACAHLSSLEHRIVELSTQLDDERVRLAACGVAAMANTRESMAERIARDNPYWSESYGDVCRAVDKQVAYREQIESQPNQEALVQAALEAARKTVEKERLAIEDDDCDGAYNAAIFDVLGAIRALSAQQIIESCKEKS